ncbi:MAG: hypothetical protein AB1480_09075 [Nitrospirota bacterium]
MLNDKNEKFLLGIAAICVALLGIGIAGTVIFSRAWLHFGIASIAIVIFFGLALIEKASISQPWSLRRPIAATIVVVYLMLVITFAFYMLKEELPKISDMLLTSFTTVVGVVIAFYFGSSAL